MTDIMETIYREMFIKTRDYNKVMTRYTVYANPTSTDD